MNKKYILLSIFLGMLCFVPAGVKVIAKETVSEAKLLADIQYGTRRPYSFYYPYNYKYYTPYRHNSWQTSSSACYWLYANGTYLYRCH